MKNPHIIIQIIFPQHLQQPIELLDWTTSLPNGHITNDAILKA